MPPSGLSAHSPFASPNQQLNKASPASCLNSQNFLRHTSSPGLATEAPPSNPASFHKALLVPGLVHDTLGPLCLRAC